MTEVLPVPELGPLLGRLTAPPVPASPRSAVALLAGDRLELATALFERGAAARSQASWAAARAELDPARLRAAWDAAVDNALERLTAQANAELAAAAEAARMPRRLRGRLGVNPAERAAMRTRLAASAAGMARPLERLDGASNRDAWDDALAGSIRAIESAWLALEERAQGELGAWQAEAVRVRAWHRPRWPFVLTTLALLGLALWLGLGLGGYIPLPAWLDGLAQWAWTRT